MSKMISSSLFVHVLLALMISFDLCSGFSIGAPSCRVSAPIHFIHQAADNKELKIKTKVKQTDFLRKKLIH